MHFLVNSFGALLGHKAENIAPDITQIVWLVGKGARRRQRVLYKPYVRYSLLRQRSLHRLIIDKTD